MEVEGEDKLCLSAKEIVLANVDWDCQVKTFFRNENAGCKKAVSEAISWFFTHVEQGIILEDDCLPHPSFFPFAEEMLEKYKDDEDIIAVNGCNYGFNYRSSSYFFSRYMNAWGWATWRRVANKIKYKIPNWNKEKKVSFLRSRLKKQTIDLDVNWFQYWTNIFDMLSTGELDTWDYYWLYHQFLYKKKNIMAAKNLIKNIGFSSNATHTTLLSHPASNLPMHELIFPLIHPVNKKINKQFEEEILKPVCYMYTSKPNSFYYKNRILQLARFLFIKGQKK